MSQLLKVKCLEGTWASPCEKTVHFGGLCSLQDHSWSLRSYTDRGKMSPNVLVIVLCHDDVCVRGSRNQDVWPDKKKFVLLWLEYLGDRA